MKKNIKTFYNASESADYLEVSRQYFYILRTKHKLKPAKREYNMNFYAAMDLDKIRRLIRKWKAAHEKRVWYNSHP